MASFVPSEKTKNDFNKGIKYENGDGVQAETINNLIESQLFVQGIATNQPKVVEDGTEGSPTVYFENKDGLQRFVFKNIRGQPGGKGDDGDDGNIIRFVDGALNTSSDIGTPLNLSITHILNSQEIAVGDIVFDPYFSVEGNGYLCMWQVTHVNTNGTVDLNGLGYVLAPKGVDGKTPYIDGADWYIDGVYQGRAEGFSPTIEVEKKSDNEYWIYITDINTVGTPDPIKIKEGRDGVGIKSIDQTTENTGSGELNVIKVYDDNNKEIGSFNIRNGGRGEKGDTITGVVQSVTSDTDGGVNQIKVTISNGDVYTFEVKNGSKGSKGDNGNIMRFTDSALYSRSDVGVTTNISASNLINGGDVAQGDVVLDTHYSQAEEYYICIWEVTQVSSTAQGIVVSLRGMGYIISSKGGNVKIDVDDELSTTSTNPVQNSVVTIELNKKVNKEGNKVLSDNNYTTEDKNKLAGIEANAQVNQNAFSNIKVGETTISASGKTDVLKLSSGNLTIQADPEQNQLSFSVNNGTLNQKGVVQLEDSVESTSTLKAATPNSVKTAYDKAVSAEKLAGGKLDKSGGTMTGRLVNKEGITLTSNAGSGVKTDAYGNIFPADDISGSWNVFQGYDASSVALLSAEFKTGIVKSKGNELLHAGNYETYIRNYMNKTILEQPY